MPKKDIELIEFSIDEFWKQVKEAKCVEDKYGEKVCYVEIGGKRFVCRIDEEDGKAMCALVDFDDVFTEIKNNGIKSKLKKLFK